MNPALKLSYIDAINRCLSAVGTAPVSSLDEPSADVLMAKAEIDKANGDLQAEGWYWNTVEEYPLTPDTSGNVRVPQNVIEVDTNALSDIGVYVRNGSVYDSQTGAPAKFTGPITVSAVVFLPWDSLPYLAQSFIAAKASHAFASKVQSDYAVSQELLREVQTSRARLNADAIRQTDASMFQSISVNRQFMSRYRQRF